MRRLPVLLALVGLVAVASPAVGTRSDPLIESQWGLAQVRAPFAWDTTQGRGVLVGIVDTGIDFDHPDLRHNVVPGRTFLSCGPQGCGDGHWLSGQPGNPATARPSVHGTHVAGIVGAGQADGVGIAGVAPEARLLAVKVLDDDGGTWEDVAWGIRYAVDRGARVVNLSLGASLVGAQALTVAAELTGGSDPIIEAVRYAADRGGLVVAAAGNSSTPLCGTPAVIGGVLCVRATDPRQAPSWYSNTATKPDGLALAAPGGGGLFCNEGVLSTVPTSSPLSWCGAPRGYDYLSGTSMAAPHVAGVAALLAAEGRSRDDILAALTSTARDPVTGARGVANPVLGYGIVDAEAAVG
jgi:subtilisin family serine protease